MPGLVPGNPRGGETRRFKIECTQPTRRSPAWKAGTSPRLSGSSMIETERELPRVDRRLWLLNLESCGGFSVHEIGPNQPDQLKMRGFDVAMLSQDAEQKIGDQRHRDLNAHRVL